METSNEFIALIAGLIASPLFEFAKRKLGWEGEKAYWLAFAFSLVCAVVGIAVFGDLAFDTPEQLAISLVAVLGAAQLAYKIVVRPAAERFAG